MFCVSKIKVPQRQCATRSRIAPSVINRRHRLTPLAVAQAPEATRLSGLTPSHDQPRSKRTYDSPQNPNSENRNRNTELDNRGDNEASRRRKEGTLYSCAALLLGAAGGALLAWTGVHDPTALMILEGGLLGGTLGAVSASTFGYIALMKAELAAADLRVAEQQRLLDKQWLSLAESERRLQHAGRVIQELEGRMYIQEGQLARYSARLQQQDAAISSGSGQREQTLLHQQLSDLRHDMQKLEKEGVALGNILERIGRVTGTAEALK